MRRPWHKISVGEMSKWQYRKFTRHLAKCRSQPSKSVEQGAACLNTRVDSQVDPDLTQVKSLELTPTAARLEETTIDDDRVCCSCEYERDVYKTEAGVPGVKKAGFAKAGTKAEVSIPGGRLTTRGRKAKRRDKWMVWQPVRNQNKAVQTCVLQEPGGKVVSSAETQTKSCMFNNDADARVLVKSTTGAWEPFQNKMLHAGLRVRMFWNYKSYRAGAEGTMQCIRTSLQGQCWCLVDPDDSGVTWVPASFLGARVSVRDVGSQTEAFDTSSSAHAMTLGGKDDHSSTLLSSLHRLFEYLLSKVARYNDARSFRNIKVALSQARSDLNILYTRHGWKLN